MPINERGEFVRETLVTHGEPATVSEPPAVAPSEPPTMHPPATSGRHAWLVLALILMAPMLITFLLTESTRTRNVRAARSANPEPNGVTKSISNVASSAGIIEIPALKVRPRSISMSSDFSLVIDGQRLSPPLLYTGADKPTRATVSELSPTGRFLFIALCGIDWCDDVRLVNLHDGQIHSINLPKYHVMTWVRWSKDDRFAVLSQPHAGWTELSAVYTNRVRVVSLDKVLGDGSLYSVDLDSIDLDAKGDGLRAIVSFEDGRKEERIVSAFKPSLHCEITETAAGEDFVGEWYDGRGDCMKIQATTKESIFATKAWYCEVGEPTEYVLATLRNGGLRSDKVDLVVRRCASGKVISSFRYPPPNESWVNRYVLLERVARKGSMVPIELSDGEAPPGRDREDGFGNRRTDRSDLNSGRSIYVGAPPPISSPPPDPIAGLLMEAEQKIADGDYDGALADAQSAVRFDPRDTRATDLLARVGEIRKILK